VATAARGGGKTAPAFRAWLRELRERAGLTQEELAAAIGCDRRNVRRWEIEGHDPSGTVLLRILDALGVELVPTAPGPRAVNAAVEELQHAVREREDAAARRHDELMARLEELRELSAVRAATTRRF
jgi:transcriptional regulator with XRE-family HTH domain